MDAENFLASVSTNQSESKNKAARACDLAALLQKAKILPLMNADKRGSEEVLLSMIHFGDSGVLAFPVRVLSVISCP